MIVKIDNHFFLFFLVKSIIDNIAEVNTAQNNTYGAIAVIGRSIFFSNMPNAKNTYEPIKIVNEILDILETFVLVFSSLVKILLSILLNPMFYLYIIYIYIIFKYLSTGIPIMIIIAIATFMLLTFL